MQTRMRDLGIGVMAQPGSYSPATVNGWTWAADNGCFNNNWDPQKWVTWLERMRHTPRCLFAVVPDKVGDAVETLHLFHQWAPIVRDLGYPLAFVAQDGATGATIPWGQIRCVFIGGSTQWKLGAHAETITRYAQTIGIHVHMGRVNSTRRMAIAESWGVDSCDGTYLAFGPNQNLPRLERMLHHVNTTPSLFGQGAHT